MKYLQVPVLTNPRSSRIEKTRGKSAPTPGNESISITESRPSDLPGTLKASYHIKQIIAIANGPFIMSKIQSIFDLFLTFQTALGDLSTMYLYVYELR